MSEEGTVVRTSPPRWNRSGLVAIGVAVVLAAAALTVAVVTRTPAAATTSEPGCGGSTPRLSVEGTGRSSATPNSLDFSAQVSVTAESAKGALAADNSTTSAVVAAITVAGVKSRDIQTTDLTINPTYTFSGGHSVISGYNVTNSLAVTIDPITGAGAVIDAATNAGGDSFTVSSLSFAPSDPRGLEDQARGDAVRQAVTHAAAMARASGQRLGTLCSLTDQSGLDQGVVTPLEYGAVASSAASVPLEGGTQQASAQVKLVYELVPLGR